MSGGSHTAVLSEQAVNGLNVRGDGIYVDCTFGRGGHSRLILARLGRAGRLLALDRDAEAVAAGGAIGDGRFRILHGRFSRRASSPRRPGSRSGRHPARPRRFLAAARRPARGFSFRFDAPLDMRMDASGGITAADWLGRCASRKFGRS